MLQHRHGHRFEIVGGHEIAPGKRGRLVERLLASESYAVNWGRYWRDVVTYHTPASANYIRWQLFDSWWADQVRRNRPFNDVVTTLVTASGVTRPALACVTMTGIASNMASICPPRRSLSAGAAPR